MFGDWRIGSLYDIGFLNKRSNAVFLGKSYLIIIFLSNLLLLLGGDYGDYGWGSLPQILKALILGLFGLFIFACLSKFPIYFRRKNGKF